MSCIDLIITDQPNLYVDFEVDPSLDNHCQHQIIHGKLNISVPTPPPYKRKIWYYAKAQKDKIKAALGMLRWSGDKKIGKIKHYKVLENSEGGGEGTNLQWVTQAMSCERYIKANL